MERASGSVLRAAGLPELIATSHGEYEEMAVRLAQDDAFWARVTGADVARSALFDVRAAMRSFEAGIGEAVRRAAAGLKPDHIEVPFARNRAVDEL